MPENLDFIPSIHCLSSLSLSDIYLEGKQLHKEVKFVFSHLQNNLEL